MKFFDSINEENQILGDFLSDSPMIYHQHVSKCARQFSCIPSIFRLSNPTMLTYRLSK